MNNITKNVLMVSGAFAIGIAAGIKLTTKSIEWYYGKNVDNDDRVEKMVFSCRKDAGEAISHLVTLIIKYGHASVADLYAAVGKNSTLTNNKYGWTSDKNMGMKKTRYGYELILPKTVELK